MAMKTSHINKYLTGKSGLPVIKKNFQETFRKYLNLIMPKEDRLLEKPIELCLKNLNFL